MQDTYAEFHARSLKRKADNKGVLEKLQRYATIMLVRSLHLRDRCVNLMDAARLQHANSEEGEPVGMFRFRGASLISQIDAWADPTADLLCALDGPISAVYCEITHYHTVWCHNGTTDYEYCFTVYIF
jgi:hypothetical protein